MLRNRWMGAAAAWTLLAGIATAVDVEERAMDGVGAADPVACEEDGPRAEASQACTDPRAALGPEVTPTIATEPLTAGESARAAFDPSPAIDGDRDGTARPTTPEDQPNPSGVDAPSYWPGP